MDQMGDGPGHVRATTVALDAVTFPIQAVVLGPVYAVSSLNEMEDKHKAKEKARLISLLEKNPALGLNERWDLKTDQHQAAFIDSFSDPKIKYTDELLEQIRQTCPSMQDYVFRSQSCSQEYLVKHFSEEFEKSKNPANQIGLANIVSNPKTPFELVYQTTSIQGYACSAAYQAIYKRDSEAKKFLMGMLEKDPSLEYAPRVELEGRWRSNNLQHTFRDGLIDSFSNPSVKYNDNLLEQIYQKYRDVRDYIFRCRYCSSDFLARHFNEEYELSKKWSFQHGLEDIIANPNTPIELIEKVANSHDFDRITGNHGNISQQAQKVLAERSSEH
jgi:hypothetical protein